MSYVHLNQPSGSRCGADLARVSNNAKSRELARASCCCGSTTAACSPCSKRAFSFACAVLLFSFVLDSTGARLLILWIRPTLRAQVAFLTTVPTNNVLAWIRIQTLILTFAFCLAVLAITFPFLAFLALRVTFAKAVMRTDFGGLQCGLGFHFAPART